MAPGGQRRPAAARLPPGPRPGGAAGAPGGGHRGRPGVRAPDRLSPGAGGTMPSNLLPFGSDFYLDDAPAPAEPFHGARNALPFGSEFTPTTMSLRRLLELAHEHDGNRQAFQRAVRLAYFETRDTSATNKKKLAGNTCIAMSAYGL